MRIQRAGDGALAAEQSGIELFDVIQKAIAKVNENQVGSIAAIEPFSTSNAMLTLPKKGQQYTYTALNLPSFALRAAQMPVKIATRGRCSQAQRCRFPVGGEGRRRPAAANRVAAKDRRAGNLNESIRPLIPETGSGGQCRTAQASPYGNAVGLHRR